MGKRRSSRELAVQALHHLDVNGGDALEAVLLVSRHFGSKRGLEPFAVELVAGVTQNAVEIDRLIKDASRHWRLERMSLVDRNILKVAVFEMGWREDIPPRVSIDEAVEIGKVFGGDSSPSFINGVLDRILTTLADSGRLTGLDACAEDA